MSDIPICALCQLYGRFCPLLGMTDSMDEPLMGHLVECIHFLPIWCYHFVN